MRRVITTVLATLLGLSVMGTTATMAAWEYRFWGGHRYENVDKDVSWFQANQFCKQRNAHLVTIRSAKENRFVFRMSPQSWLGATDRRVEGKWRWVTGEPFSYSNWLDGKPDDGSGAQDYATYAEPFGGNPNRLWMAVPASYNGPFVCERTQKSLLRGISVEVRCDARPERVIVKNNRKRTITIKNVGSLYRPRAAEPFRVQTRLNPGKKIVYTFGPGRGPNKLSSRFIFTDDADREGVRVFVEDRGAIKRSCP